MRCILLHSEEPAITHAGEAREGTVPLTWQPWWDTAMFGSVAWQSQVHGLTSIDEDEGAARLEHPGDFLQVPPASLAQGVVPNHGIQAVARLFVAVVTTMQRWARSANRGEREREQGYL